MAIVEDPALIARLDAAATAGQGQNRAVTDPDLIRRLDAVPGQSRPPSVPDRSGIMGRVDTVARGVADMASFGGADEFAAFMDALTHPLLGRGSAGESFGERYNRNVTQERAVDAADERERPLERIGGQLVGAVVNPVGQARAAQLASRPLVELARSGAITGGLYGLGSGEGVEGRVSGGVGGAAVGAALAPGVEIARRGVTGLARLAYEPVAPYVSAVRGLINPTAEAERRVSGAYARDARTANTTPAQMVDDVRGPAAQTGQPVAPIDFGGETTRALGRSAANTSDEAAAALRTMADGRFEGQTDRAIAFIRRLNPEMTDNPAQVEAILEAARRANRPAYDALYRSAPHVWDESLEILTGSPVVQTAMRQALVSSRSEAARAGISHPPNPFTLQNGQFVLRDENVVPGIAFWDHVQRNLRRAGPDGENLARSLNQHLDEVVPAFRQTRQGAARFFDAEDAIDAGRNFVTPGRLGLENPEARRALGQMTREEQNLFRQGFAAEMTRMLGEVRDRRDVLNQIFIGGPRGSNAARERIEIAMGPAQARELEAFLRIEGIMSTSREALQGNSSTVRQLMAAGLAGGAAGAYSTGDFTGALSGAGAAATLRRYAIPVIDQRVAQRVGEILASGNPAQIDRLVQQSARNPRMMDTIRMIEGRLAGQVAGQQSAAQGPGIMRSIQGPVPGRTDEQQGNGRPAPRPGQ